MLAAQQWELMAAVKCQRCGVVVIGTQDDIGEQMKDHREVGCD
jgi:stalled ribosome rescue protein Dom34